MDAGLFIGVRFMCTKAVLSNNDWFVSAKQYTEEKLVLEYSHLLSESITQYQLNLIQISLFICLFTAQSFIVYCFQKIFGEETSHLLVASFSISQVARLFNKMFNNISSDLNESDTYSRFQDEQ